MQPTVYQKPELRDANDNIIQQGAFGKNTALCNATNNGWIDYVMNNLEFLYGIAKDEVVPVPALPASGQTNKTYLLTTTGVSYRWSGTQWVAVSSSEAVGRAEAAANLAEQWATKTDGTVDGTEYSAKYYAQQAEASADDAQDVADDMATHLVQIDKNTGGVAKNSKRISNIEKLLQGNLYDYDTDDDEAYVKDVPAGALPYAGIGQIGGKTLVWNQLSYQLNESAVINGITWTKNDDGTYSAVGTSTGSTYRDTTSRLTSLAGHKILIKGCPANDGTNKYMIYDGYSNGSTSGDYGYGKIYTAGANVQIRCFIASDATVDLVFTPQVFDLTLMFGSGNEPTTVEEFEAMFPADYYPYNAGTLLSAGVTEVESKDSNDVTLQTLSIPAEVQALDGYGWSAGNVSNYIDFERKVFVKNVARVDLGTLNWVKWGNNRYGFYASIPTSKGVPNGSVANGICEKYIATDYGSVVNGNKDKAFNLADSTKMIYLYDSSYQEGTATEFKSAMSGVYLYCELLTPVETDISAYLTDNLIEVESGGTLTFPNANGNDYHIPVPSTETYMIDLQEAIENGN